MPEAPAAAPRARLSGRSTRINLNLYVTDIPLWYTPAIGPAVEIRLSYNSQAVAVPNAPFGNKWQFNYQSSLAVGSGSVTVTMPDGREDVYIGSGGTYTAPTGVFSTLENVGGNRYELKFTDGEVYVYDIPSGTTLTNPVLVEIRDAYGNALTFRYNTSNQLGTITDAQSRVTTLQYTDGHITTITDPYLRSATFGYTGNELTSITDMGGYVAEMVYQVSPGDNQVYISSLSNKGIGGYSTPVTWGFYIEPNDGINNNSNLSAPGGAMWENYRITVTACDNGLPQWRKRGVLLLWPL
jgi:YD repeat-containing protein